MSVRKNPYVYGTGRMRFQSRVSLKLHSRNRLNIEIELPRQAWQRTTLVRRARRDGYQTMEGWCLRKNCDARAEAEPSNPRASDSRWNYRELLLPEAQCR